MNSIPPSEVGIWAALPLSNLGMAIPHASACETIARVRHTIVTIDKAIRPGCTPRIRFVSTVSASASTSNGTVRVEPPPAMVLKIPAPVPPPTSRRASHQVIGPEPYSP